MRYQTAPRPGDGSILEVSGRPGSNRRRELGRLQCYQLHHARGAADYRFGSASDRWGDAGCFAKLTARGTVLLEAGSPADFTAYAAPLKATNHARSRLPRLGGGGARDRGRGDG